MLAFRIIIDHLVNQRKQHESLVVRFRDSLTLFHPEPRVLRDAPIHAFRLPQAAFQHSLHLVTRKIFASFAHS